MGSYKSATRGFQEKKQLRPLGIHIIEILTIPPLSAALTTSTFTQFLISFDLQTLVSSGKQAQPPNLLSGRSFRQL
jgi:hypothetical protein